MSVSRRPSKEGVVIEYHPLDIRLESNRRAEVEAEYYRARRRIPSVKGQWLPWERTRAEGLM